jgi:hypothetical protein
VAANSRDVNDASPEGQLVQLRDITSRIDALHEAQILQLENWPRIVIQGVTEVTLRVAIPKRVVNFEIVAAGPAPPRENLVILAKNVRWLLGDEWTIGVRINKKKVFQERSLYAPKS